MITGSIRKYIFLFCILFFNQILTGCGLHFSGAPENTPYPADIKTIQIESAGNSTTIAGIETEITNQLRTEFALEERLTPVRNNADVVLHTIIREYEDTPSTYRADGKELTRIGTLKLECWLEQPTKNKRLWQKDLSASNIYNVTDTITGTLTNRRYAISRMIKDLIPRIHKSVFENF